MLAKLNRPSAMSWKQRICELALGPTSCPLKRLSSTYNSVSPDPRPMWQLTRRTALLAEPTSSSEMMLEIGEPMWVYTGSSDIGNYIAESTLFTAVKPRGSSPSSSWHHTQILF